MALCGTQARRYAHHGAKRSSSPSPMSKEQIPAAEHQDNARLVMAKFDMHMFMRNEKEPRSSGEHAVKPFADKKNEAKMTSTQPVPAQCSANARLYLRKK